MGIMLEQFKATSHQRGDVLSFLEWLRKEYNLELDFASAKPGTPLSVPELIDSFFGIDRRKLDDERRQLLESIAETAL